MLGALSLDPAFSSLTASEISQGAHPFCHVSCPHVTLYLLSKPTQLKTSTSQGKNICQSYTTASQLITLTLTSACHKLSNSLAQWLLCLHRGLMPWGPAVMHICKVQARMPTTCMSNELVSCQQPVCDHVLNLQNTCAGGDSLRLAYTLRRCSCSPTMSPSNVTGNMCSMRDTNRLPLTAESIHLQLCGVLCVPCCMAAKVDLGHSPPCLLSRTASFAH